MGQITIKRNLVRFLLMVIAIGIACKKYQPVCLREGSPPKEKKCIVITGRGNGTGAQFKNPFGVSTDAKGNGYTTDKAICEFVK